MGLSRRDLLRALAVSPLAPGLLAGCGDEPERGTGAVAGDLLGPDVEAGHRLRDGELAPAVFASLAPERIGVAILGGGPAGLAAAWRLARSDVPDVHLLELEPVLGGTSRDGETPVTRHPWGAHYLPLPMAHNEPLLALLSEMGALEGTDERGEPRGAEHLLVREPEERVYYRGFWYPGLYPYAGASPEDLAQLRRFRTLVDGYVAMRDGRGRRAFALPVAYGSDDPEVTALDRVSAARWLSDHGLDSPRLRWLVEYACRDDYGLALGDTSAWAMLLYWAARMSVPGEDTRDLLAWPEGNGALVRHMAAASRVRARPRHLVVDVAPVDGGVRVDAFDLARERPVRLLAERAVVAMPRFVARRVVAPLRARDDEGFTYGPWMVANLHLRGRPAEPSYPLCWDNVLYDSPSLGYVTATHQRGRDHGPTVLTYYLPYTDSDPAEGRRRLLDTPWTAHRDAIAADLARAHPDLLDHLERVDVFRWGHAMIQPRVGFAFGGARARAAAPIDRIHFAHSDLSGVALFEEAFHHGVRAADEIIGALRAVPDVPGEAAPAAAAPAEPT